jgi:hypothetical protein
VAEAINFGGADVVADVGILLPGSVDVIVAEAFLT